MSSIQPQFPLGLSLEDCVKLLLELANSNPIDDRRDCCIHCWEETQCYDEDEDETEPEPANELTTLETEFYFWHDKDCIWVRTRRYLVESGMYVEAKHYHSDSGVHPACMQIVGDIIPIVDGQIICPECKGAS